MKKCKWEKVEYVTSDDSYWKTSCGEVHNFYQGNIEYNHFKFCPYCGKLIREKIK